MEGKTPIENGYSIMNYRDIVECIKLNQIKQCISVKTLAERVGVSTQTITNIRGYRLMVSADLFDKILKELSVCDITDTEKFELLRNQNIAKENKRKRNYKDKIQRERKKNEI
jgi:transcriptional regulator with XRE-family HTH domain